MFWSAEALPAYHSPSVLQFTLVWEGGFRGRGSPLLGFLIILKPPLGGGGAKVLSSALETWGRGRLTFGVTVGCGLWADLRSQGFFLATGAREGGGGQNEKGRHLFLVGTHST